MRAYYSDSLKSFLGTDAAQVRSALVIFVPPGDDIDGTRDPGYYDRTYEYLRGIGIPELACPKAAGR